MVLFSIAMAAREQIIRRNKIFRRRRISWDDTSIFLRHVCYKNNKHYFTMIDRKHGRQDKHGDFWCEIHFYIPHGSQIWLRKCLRFEHCLEQLQLGVPWIACRKKRRPECGSGPCEISMNFVISKDLFGMTKHEWKPFMIHFWISIRTH